MDAEFSNCGIYAIENILNGHRYVGSSVDVPKRVKAHFAELRRNKHHSQYLQHAWNKYGEDSFRWVFLLVCAKSELLIYEQELIDQWHPEYNILPTAGSPLGHHHSKETKKKIGNALRNPPEELRKRWSEIHKGVYPSAEARQKMSQAHMGNKCAAGHRHTEEWKKQASRKFSGAGNPMYGVHLASKKKGIPLTEEQKKKISLARTGKKYGPRSKEIGRKIAESLRRFYANKKRTPSFA